MINGLILQEDITVLHRFVPNNRISKYTGLIWTFGVGVLRVTSSQTAGLPSVQGRGRASGTAGSVPT